MQNEIKELKAQLWDILAQKDQLTQVYNQKLQRLAQIMQQTPQQVNETIKTFVNDEPLNPETTIEEATEATNE